MSFSAGRARKHDTASALTLPDGATPSSAHALDTVSVTVSCGLRPRALFMAPVSIVRDMASAARRVAETGAAAAAAAAVLVEDLGDGLEEASDSTLAVALPPTLPPAPLLSLSLSLELLAAPEEEEAAVGEGPSCRLTMRWLPTKEMSTPWSADTRALPGPGLGLAGVGAGCCRASDARGAGVEADAVGREGTPTTGVGATGVDAWGAGAATGAAVGAGVGVGAFNFDSSIQATVVNFKSKERDT